MRWSSAGPRSRPRSPRRGPRSPRSSASAASSSSSRSGSSLLQDRLPSEKETPTLYRALSSAAEQAGLGVSLFQPREARAKDVVSEIPITLSAEGSYHQLAKFFERVARAAAGGDRQRLQDVRTSQGEELHEGRHDARDVHVSVPRPRPRPQARRADRRPSRRPRCPASTGIAREPPVASLGLGGLCATLRPAAARRLRPRPPRPPSRWRAPAPAPTPALRRHTGGAPAGLGALPYRTPAVTQYEPKDRRDPFMPLDVIKRSQGTRGGDDEADRDRSRREDHARARRGPGRHRLHPQAGRHARRWPLVEIGADNVVFSVAAKPGSQSNRVVLKLAAN